MNLIVRTIKPKDFKAAYRLQSEYLDSEMFEEFVHRVDENPELYLIALDDAKVIGVCYGKEHRHLDSTAVLEGIAVNLNERHGYARKGVGSKLLEHFKGAVKEIGLGRVSVGSAEDPKVEHFYLKNRFKPKELVAKDEKGNDISRVSIGDYELGKIERERLRKRLIAKEIIFIFDIELD